MNLFFTNKLAYYFINPSYFVIQVPRLGLLITLDETTYDYYFQQARNDVNENKIPEIKYPEHKQELLGLGIADM